MKKLTEQELIEVRESLRDRLQKVLLLKAQATKCKDENGINHWNETYSFLKSAFDKIN